MSTAAGQRVAGAAAEEATRFRLSEERFAPDGLVLSASGELDIVAAPLLRERTTGAIEAGVRKLVVDLCLVSFMDSVALAALLQARRCLGDRGRMGVVIPGGSYTRLIFEVAGLPRCLDLFETYDEALAHVCDAAEPSPRAYAA